MKRHWIARLIILVTLLQQGGAVMAAILSNHQLAEAHVSLREEGKTDRTGPASGCHTEDAVGVPVVASVGLAAHHSTTVENLDCCTFECECCVGGCAATILTQASSFHLMSRAAYAVDYYVAPPLAPSFSFLKPPISA